MEYGVLMDGMTHKESRGVSLQADARASAAAVLGAIAVAFLIGSLSNRLPGPAELSLLLAVIAITAAAAHFAWPHIAAQMSVAAEGGPASRVARPAGGLAALTAQLERYARLSSEVEQLLVFAPSIQGPLDTGAIAEVARRLRIKYAVLQSGSTSSDVGSLRTWLIADAASYGSDRLVLIELAQRTRSRAVFVAMSGTQAALLKQDLAGSAIDWSVVTTDLVLEGGTGVH
jgi:hypothetical protein